MTDLYRRLSAIRRRFEHEHPDRAHEPPSYVLNFKDNRGDPTASQVSRFSESDPDGRRHIWQISAAGRRTACVNCGYVYDAYRDQPEKPTCPGELTVDFAAYATEQPEAAPGHHISRGEAHAWETIAGIPISCHNCGMRWEFYRDSPDKPVCPGRQSYRVAEPAPAEAPFKALGRSGAEWDGEIETIDRPPLVGDAQYTSDEVTALCPVTGQPDWYTVSLYVMPNDKLPESKSLKLWLQSFRNTGIFAEAFAARLADELAASLCPRYLSVEVKQKSRGGIAIDATAIYQQEAIRD